MQVWWNDCTWLVGTPPGFWVWETPASSHPHPLPPFWRKISPPMSSWVLEAFSPHPHPFLSLRETPTPSPQSLCLSTLCICVFMFLCCSGFDKRACTFQKQFREFLKTRENILSLLRRSVTESPSGFYPCCVFCPCWEGHWLKTLLDFILVVCSVPVEKVSDWKPFWILSLLCVLSLLRSLVNVSTCPQMYLFVSIPVQFISSFSV